MSNPETVRKGPFMYGELGDLIAKMTPEQKASNVTLYNSETDEFQNILSFCITQDADVLDSDHPYLEI